MTPDPSDLIPLAAELVGTVRDYSPADVAAVLARVPNGRHDALAVILAAMVDPDATPRELLAWTDSGLEYHRLVAAGVSARTASVLAAGMFHDDVSHRPPRRSRRTGTSSSKASVKA